jgi:hypothetical protein
MPARKIDLGARMIETGSDLIAARHRLGWSQGLLADALRLTGRGAQLVREMERDRRPVSGPISVAVEALETGFRPEGFSDGEPA